MGRVDHNFTSNNRLYVTGYWNKREEDRYNWAQDINGGDHQRPRRDAAASTTAPTSA